MVPRACREMSFYFLLHFSIQFNSIQFNSIQFVFFQYRTFKIHFNGVLGRLWPSLRSCQDSFFFIYHNWLPVTFHGDQELPNTSKWAQVHHRGNYSPGYSVSWGHMVMTMKEIIFFEINSDFFHFAQKNLAEVIWSTLQDIIFSLHLDWPFLGLQADNLSKYPVSFVP